MSQLDYAGAQGGQLAMAFAAGVAFASSILVAAGGFIWRVFFDARIKELQADRAADQLDCDKEVAVLRQRIVQLETILMAYGPPMLRQQLQSAIAEQAAAAAAAETAG